MDTLSLEQELRLLLVTAKFTGQDTLVAGAEEVWEALDNDEMRQAYVEAWRVIVNAGRLS